MNIIVLQLLVIAFFIFSGILVTIAWTPIIKDILNHTYICKKKIQHQSFDAIQVKSFCSSLTPEVILALNSLKGKYQ